MEAQNKKSFVRNQRALFRMALKDPCCRLFQRPAAFGLSAKYLR